MEANKMMEPTTISFTGTLIKDESNIPTTSLYNFNTGALRDSEANKLDFSYISPAFLEEVGFGTDSLYSRFAMALGSFILHGPYCDQADVLDRLTKELMHRVGYERLIARLKEAGKVYGKSNWTKGQDYNRLIRSMLRHLYACEHGKLTEPEDHEAAILCNVMFLLHFIEADFYNEIHTDLDNTEDWLN
jgi:hypothetical protein